MSNLSKETRSQRYAIDNVLRRVDTDKTFLHDRPEPVVYELLNDAYRFFAEDERMFPSEAGPMSLHSLYAGGEAGAERGYRDFLQLAETRQPNILPPWWTAGKKEECVKYAVDKVSGWHRLDLGVARREMDDFYAYTMYRHLRILARDITGKHYGGDSGFTSKAGERLVAMMVSSGDCGFGGHGSQR